MKKFLTNIILFLIVAVIIGEITVRITHAVSDVPKRTVDASGIQKYLPNQEGYWKGGGHKWTVNEYGWPGQLPESFDNLVLVIGDSFIENFMNPNQCHQAILLKEKLKNNNFLELGRSGVSLIEAMEISEQLDTLRPLKSLIYVNDSDFYESISEVKPMPDITQLNINDNVIVHGKIKAPGFKKILYNWKLLYYFYNTFPINLNIKAKEKPEQELEVRDDGLKHEQEITKLLEFITNKYRVNDKILVFHPNSSELLIKKCENVGLNVIELDSSNDKDWTFGYDHHWTCYGNKKAAQQISIQLINFLQKE